ncbi:hypothetical protein ACFE04_029853 [Oxalis oulophora]
MAAIPAQLNIGFLGSLAPVPDISAIERRSELTEESRRRETKSPRPSTAAPRKSKPGPRFATVAGANDLTEVYTGSDSVVVWRETLHLKSDVDRDNDANEFFNLVSNLMFDERKKLFVCLFSNTLSF